MVKRLILSTIALVIVPITVLAQEELGVDTSPSSSWAMFSYQRTWLPQANDAPNAGIAIQAYSSLDDDKRWWAGANIAFVGVDRRDAVSIAAGPAWFFLGDGKLGAFTFAQLGLVMTSASGLTSFDFFSDRSLQFGLSTGAGLGATVQISRLFRLQTSIIANWYTVDGGNTPYGIQIGLSSGGR